MESKTSTHSRATAGQPDWRTIRPAPRVLMQGHREGKKANILKILSNITLVIPIVLEAFSALKRAGEAVKDLFEW